METAILRRKHCGDIPNSIHNIGNVLNIVIVSIDGTGSVLFIAIPS